MASEKQIHKQTKTTKELDDIQSYQNNITSLTFYHDGAIGTNSTMILLTKYKSHG